MGLAHVIFASSPARRGTSLRHCRSITVSAECIQVLTPKRAQFTRNYTALSGPVSTTSAKDLKVCFTRVTAPAWC